MRFCLLIFLLSFSSFILFAQTASPHPKKFSRLVWADEFNYNGLPDSTKWSYETGYIRNNELQYYTLARKENAWVQNGFLHLTARNDSLVADGKMRPITSASINTKGKADWTYGRIEVRANFSSSLGSWPAIWTLGSNIDSVPWPLCGEIDIMEHVGFMPDTVHFNVHTKAKHKGTRVYNKAASANFHVYVLEWFPDHLDWFYDGKKVFTYANNRNGKESWPFDSPQYLLLNVAFGGVWGAQRGVDVRSLPQSMMVDYVRVYQ
jgi:beta-glucanase (GH16 family)